MGVFEQQASCLASKIEFEKMARLSQSQGGDGNVMIMRRNQMRMHISGRTSFGRFLGLTFAALLCGVIAQGATLKKIVAVSRLRTRLRGRARFHSMTAWRIS